MCLAASLLDYSNLRASADVVSLVWRWRSEVSLAPYVTGVCCGCGCATEDEACLLACICVGESALRTREGKGGGGRGGGKRRRLGTELEW
jgi:hypothetical protein